MTKRMTAEEIESVIESSVGSIAEVMTVTREPRIWGNAMRKALRSCFTAGQDNGQAIILERAESADSSSASLAQQAGNATLEIMAWTAAVPGRTFSGVSQLSGISQGRFHAGVMRGEADKAAGAEFWSEYCYGDTFLEALLNMAEWCKTHSAKRDTLPAPPLAPTSDGAIPSAEVVS